MKFALIVSKTGNEADAWRENYSDPDLTTEAETKAWADAAMARFNATLRPYETARTLHRVEFDAGSADTPHRWEKSNLVTLDDPRRGMYDLVFCKNCGCKARRYGISHIKRQKPYTSRKWAFCPESVTGGK